MVTTMIECIVHRFCQKYCPCLVVSSCFVWARIDLCGKRLAFPVFLMNIRDLTMRHLWLVSKTKNVTGHTPLTSSRAASSQRAMFELCPEFLAALRRLAIIVVNLWKLADIIMSSESTTLHLRPWIGRGRRRRRATTTNVSSFVYDRIPMVG